MLSRHDGMIFLASKEGRWFIRTAAVRRGGAIDTALQREVEEHKVSSNEFDGDCFGFLARVLSL